VATLAQVDLQKLWDQVVLSVSTPQYNAFLNRTKPLGLLPGEGGHKGCFRDQVAGNLN
jgi:chromosomal replication initiator protein